jgi:hypothetical protein
MRAAPPALTPTWTSASITRRKLLSPSPISSKPRRLSGHTDQEVTGFYVWGAWVNGGGWIHTPSVKVDFLYRNLDQVQRTINEAEQGSIQHDFDQQPAYGFYSVIYLAETKICLPLYDPQRADRLTEEAGGCLPAAAQAENYHRGSVDG